MLRVPSTYIDETYSNAYLVELAEERCDVGANEQKRIVPITERIIKRSIAELGEIYRLPDSDFRKR